MIDLTQDYLKSKNIEIDIKTFEQKNLDLVSGSRFKIVKYQDLNVRYILSYFYCLILSKFHINYSSFSSSILAPIAKADLTILLSSILLFVLSLLWGLHFSLVKVVDVEENPITILIPLFFFL